MYNVYVIVCTLSTYGDRKKRFIWYECMQNSRIRLKGVINKITIN